MIALLQRLWAIVSASGFLFKLVRNYGVLSESFKTIENVLAQMQKEDRHLPNSSEVTLLLYAISNILKTGVIDLPGVDEMQISIGLDEINKQLELSIVDTKSGKYHKLPLKGGVR